jgi:hypothetical protein
VVGADTLVDIATDRRRLVDVAGAGEGIVRHLASQPAEGTAYVVDRRGADQVVIVTPARTIRLEQPGEAAHPAWSADGRLVWSLGSRLRVWSADAPSFDIAAPRDARGLFSPAFVSSDAIVAVVAEPEPGFTRTEDEGVDNLWRFDLAAGGWDRLTDFRARGDRWTAIRTPILRGDGSLEFVRIAGVSSRTGLPSFSLWRLAEDGTSTQIRELPREMYLGGTLGGERVWNIYDEASGEWRLYAEKSASTLADLGCGAVMVDPRSVDDPDRIAAHRDATPAPSPTATPAPTPTATPTLTASPSSVPPTPTPTATPSPSPADGYRAGVLVGDFSSVEAANDAASVIRAAFGETAVVEVVDGATASNIVRPGVWAAVMLVPVGVDPFAALTDLRSRLPGYQEWSWVVSV